MPDYSTDVNTYPEARWDVPRLQRLIEDMRQRHQERDLRCAAIRTLVHRLIDQRGSGTFVPRPFDKSQLIIKAMVGELEYMLQQMVGKGIENAPRVQVNRVVSVGNEPTKRADKAAAAQERALIGMWHAEGGERVQARTAWSQVMFGAGFILCHEMDAGWGYPDRAFYDELTDDELKKLEREDWPEGKTIAVKDGKRHWAETADLWEKRKASARYEKAVHGESLFVLEALSMDKVHEDEDQRGIKCVVISEDVPASDFGAGSDYLRGGDYYDHGIYRDESGTITGGVSVGTGGTGMRSQTTATEFFTLHRIFSRNEIYYYVTGKGSAQGGLIVYYTEHDYGEVPVWAAPFMLTDSDAPEHKYSGAINAALAYAPLINQLLTMLSNLTAYKGIPRMLIMMPDGKFVMDPDSGEPLAFDTDLLGTDPSVTAYVENGGKVVSMNTLLGSQEDMFRLLEYYISRMDAVLPPPVATGHGGDSGPGYGKRLQLGEHGRYLRGIATGHAQALESVFRMKSRTMRRRKETVGMLSVPGMRGSERSHRYYIEINPDDVTDNLTVIQSSLTQEEKVAREQEGLELLNSVPPRITLRSFYEDYMLDDDPDTTIWELDVDHIRQQFKDEAQQLVFSLVRGMIPAVVAQQSRNAAQAISKQLTTPNVAEPYGVRQPGIGMPLVQQTPPTPDMPMPVDGGSPG